MHKVALAFFFFPFCSIIAQGHYSITGKIVDAKTNEPVPYVNVYLSQTTFGSSTNEEGIYKIDHVPKGQYQLVASIIGFKPVIRNIELKNEKEVVVNFNLEETIYELNTVEVEGKTPEKWLEQLALFKKLFLGENRFAEESVLKNETKLEFIENDVLFFASINEPLQIINYALGYKINAVLKSFSFDKTKRIISYEVYPSFTEIIPSSKDSLNDFIANREQVYFGSSAHLLTTLANPEKDFHEEGFEIYYLKSKVKQSAVQSVKEIVTYDHDTELYTLSSDNGSRLNNGMSSNGLGIKYTKGGKNLVSYIMFKYDKGLEFDSGGYFLNTFDHTLFGAMSKEGMAVMLPRFWKEEN